jgi:hypothetical protein
MEKSKKGNIGEIRYWRNGRGGFDMWVKHEEGWIHINRDGKNHRFETNKKLMNHHIEFAKKHLEKHLVEKAVEENFLDKNHYLDNYFMVEEPKKSLTIKKYYHGSKNLFDNFDHSFSGSGNGKSMHGFGFYFTSEKEEAFSYGKGFKEIDDLLINGKKISVPFLIDSFNLPDELENDYHKYVQRHCEDKNEATNFIKFLFKNESLFFEIKDKDRKKFDLISKKVLEADSVSTFFQEKGFIYEVEVEEKNIIDISKNFTKSVKNKIIQRLKAEGYSGISEFKDYKELEEVLSKKVRRVKNFKKFFSYLLFRSGITGVKVDFGETRTHLVVYDRKIIQIKKINN